MDTFALGLRIADKLITDGRIDKFVEDRYASWNTGIGADIISGKATMTDLEKYALEKGEVTASPSGNAGSNHERDHVQPVIPQIYRGSIAAETKQKHIDGIRHSQCAFLTGG